MDKLPDKMTGNDLVVQETHEQNVEREMLKGMDRVDRRDKRDEIISFVTTNKYRDGYDSINWNERG